MAKVVDRPKEFLLLGLRNTKVLKELKRELDVDDDAELVNLGLNTLKWVVDKERDGLRIFAVKKNASGYVATEELDLLESDPDS